MGIGARMNPFEKQQPIPKVKHILLVGSGKGGVGKSTVALNLAIGLSKLSMSVGVLDADIYGPSLPRLTGSTKDRPELNKDNQLVPCRRFGVNLMSIGHLVEESSPAIWRGPMLFKAIEQFFREVAWGELDVLVIDLPPGTGDVALTIAQKVPCSGAIVVSTPQNLSLVDTRKAIAMFEQVKIPVLGVVENMSYMLQGETKLDLFPKGQLDTYLQEKKLKKLVEIPFHPHVGLSGEAGVPILESYPDSEEGQAFKQLALFSKNYLMAT